MKEKPAAAYWDEVRAAMPPYFYNRIKARVRRTAQQACRCGATHVVTIEEKIDRCEWCDRGQCECPNRHRP